MTILCMAVLDVDGFLLDMGRVLELKNAVAAAKFGTSQHVRTFSAADVSLVAQIARRLLIVAINKVRRAAHFKSAAAQLVDVSPTISQWMLSSASVVARTMDEIAQQFMLAMHGLER